MPNDVLIRTVKIAGKDAYQLTDLGIVELGNCAEIGMSTEEMADYFDVSREWMRKQIVAQEAGGKHFRFMSAHGARELRQSMHDGAKSGDPQLLKFLGERRLKMNKTEEVVHTHNVRVIGARPAEELTAEDWRQMYAPGDIIDAEATEVDESEPVKALTHKESDDGRDQTREVSPGPAGEAGEGGSDQRGDAPNPRRRY